VNTYGAKLVKHGLSMNPLTKAPTAVASKGIKFAQVRNETDLSFASNRVGGISTKSLNKAQLSEAAFYFSPLKDAAKAAVGKPK
jgi:hypothetical protein